MEKMPSFDSQPEKKTSLAGKWLKRSAALAGAVAVGYLGELKKEKSAREIVPPSEKPKTAEAVPTRESEIDTGTDGKVKTHVEMRHIKIADGVEQMHAIEVDDTGNQMRDLGAYHLWGQKTNKQTSSFEGYGVNTRVKGNEIVEGLYSSKEGDKTTFSGYGIATETKDGKVAKTPYGESKAGKKKFRGYGIEQ